MSKPSTLIVSEYQPGPVYVGRIPYGEDIHTHLSAFCEAKGIEMAWVSLLGAVSQIRVAYYTQDTHEYIEKTLNGDYEILNGTGNVSCKQDGTYLAHLHLTLGDENYQALGGHIMPGHTKVFACEFKLQALQGNALQRGPDAQTGLALWQAHNAVGVCAL